MKPMRILMSVLMLTTGTCAFAQRATTESDNLTSGGFPKSYTRLDFSFSAMSLEHVDDAFLGPSVSLMYGESLSETIPVYCEFGWTMSWMFRNLSEDSNYDLKYKFYNIAIPINLAYRLAIPGSSNVAVTPFVGPNFKFNISGESTYDDGHTKQTTDFFDKKQMGGKSNKASRFQMGLNLGLGLTANKFYLGYRFQPDFNDYLKKNKTHTHFVSIGFQNF